MSDHDHMRLGAVTLAALRRLYQGKIGVTLSEADNAIMAASRKTVDDMLSGGQVVYGVNTGFGKLACKRVDHEDLKKLQLNLVRSHRSGVGPPLPDAVVRLTLALKVTSLAQGYSGIRPELVQILVRFIEEQIYPIIPSQGSVGASGDLAPLAEIAAALIGEGEVISHGKKMSSEQALTELGLKPVELLPKEGLALLNGTQVSTALALSGLFAIEHVYAAAVVAGAMSVDAARGSDGPFDARIHKVRGQKGQIQVAGVYRSLLATSEIRSSHENCDKVQDPYSLRCQPQVMGAVLDLMRYAAEVLEAESSAVTDNPLVDVEAGEILSGGNFHAEPVAFAADTLAIAVAEIGSMSERRTALLMDPATSGLPAFLAKNDGLQSGLMNIQVGAAQLTSENKGLAHPASVDSIPTSANQEDHVSMATHGARRLAVMAENAAAIIAIELISAAQAIDLLAPLATSEQLSKAHKQVRTLVAFHEDDRPFTAEIEALKSAILEGEFMSAVAHILPSAPAKSCS